MSFRDIGFIIDKKEKEQESKEGQTRQGFLSTQAEDLILYDLNMDEFVCK